MNTLLIYSEIGGMWGISSNEVAEFLQANQDQDVEIRINSPGGSVTEGIAIYNLLRSHNGSVSVVVDSLCASIATIIALGGNSLSMNLGSLFMIHNPWVIMGGESEDLRKEADVLDTIKEQIINIYMTKFNGSRDEIIAIMDDETWLTDTETMKFGFADMIEQQLKISASVKYDLKKFFNNIPTNKGNNMNKEENSVEAPEVEVQAEEVTPEAEAKTEEVSEVQAEQLDLEEEVEKIEAEVQNKIDPEVSMKATIEEAKQPFTKMIT